MWQGSAVSIIGRARQKTWTLKRPSDWRWRLFEMLGDLIGDRRAADAAAQRYLYGDDSEWASAVELIDTLPDTRRIPGATDLLDSLSRGLLVIT